MDGLFQNGEIFGSTALYEIHVDIPYFLEGINHAYE